MMPDTEDLLPEHIRMAAMEWRIRINNDIVDDAGLMAFEEWRDADPRHADAYDRAVTLWSAYGALDKGEMNPALFRGRFRYWLRAWLPDPLLDVSVPRARLVGAVGALAVLGLAIVTTFQFIEQPATTIENAAPVMTAHVTETGEFRDVVLTDQSSITLGPGSEIQVTMSSRERRVELVRGAAVFNVVEDAARPFFVDAEDFSVRVVGTVFDVRNNGGVVRLSVSEGVVEAAHPFVINDAPTSVMSRQELVAGQTIIATASDGLSSISEFGVETFASWRNNRLKYEDAPLSELIADANRYSNLPIVLDPSLSNIDEVKVTFSFDGNNVARMLGALPELFPVEVDRSGETGIVIRAAADRR